MKFVYCISVFGGAIDGKEEETILATNLYREPHSEDIPLPRATLVKVASAGSCRNLSLAVMPSGTLGKDLTKPTAV